MNEFPRDQLGISRTPPRKAFRMLACRNITPPELSAIKALRRQMAACHRKRDLPGYCR
jgi:DNA-binding GntR family transcriptional regulator